MEDFISRSMVVHKIRDFGNIPTEKKEYFPFLDI